MRCSELWPYRPHHYRPVRTSSTAVYRTNPVNVPARSSRLHGGLTTSKAADRRAPFIQTSKARCQKCKSQLKHEDMKKTKRARHNGLFFKYCLTCRNKKAGRLPVSSPTLVKRQESVRRPVPVLAPTVARRQENLRHLLPMFSFTSLRRQENLRHTLPVLSFTLPRRPDTTEKPVTTEEPVSNERGVECSVCADTFPAHNLLRLLACEHEPDVCRQCFLDWLSQRMESTTWERIECPSSGCENQVSHEDVKMHAPDNVFARFDDLSIRSMLSAEANFRYCMAEGCISGQIHDEGVDANIFSCGACGFRVCTVHDVPFHDDETCAQYDDRRQLEEEASAHIKRNQEAASLAEVQRCAIVCPGCRAPIQKNSGCDQMTCRQCRFQFCWVCRAPYAGPAGIRRIGNSAHSVDCAHYRAVESSLRVILP